MHDLSPAQGWAKAAQWNNRGQFPQMRAKAIASRISTAQNPTDTSSCCLGFLIRGT
jgi:hypothetical protein